jgi:hypothetical protein
MRRLRRAQGPHFIAKMDGSIVPPPPSPPPSHEGAALILALYAKRFEDKDGDPSDQPSTALTACEGEFVIRLRPTRAASRVKRRFLRTDSLCFSTAA